MRTKAITQSLGMGRLLLLCLLVAYAVSSCLSRDPGTVQHAKRTNDVRVAGFNIQTFGKAKFKNPVIRLALVRVRLHMFS